MKHSGNQFSIDNQCGFALYKQLIVDHPAQEYAKAHSKAKDGCQAILSIQDQATGTAANTLQKKQVYNQLSTAQYNGHGHFIFQAYVPHNQKAHNILADLDEPIATTKKITDFMNGISNPTLTTGKIFVNGDAHKLSNFGASQQYSCTLVEVAKTATSDGTHDGRHKISLAKHGRTPHAQQNKRN